MLDPDIVYRAPYDAFTPLLEMTRGCTHNACRFCTMYDEQPFRVIPLDEFARDLAEIAECEPKTTRLYCTGGNPFALNFEKLAERLSLIRSYMPNLKEIAMSARITDITPKSDEELRKLAALGLTELNIGHESGDDATLLLINKGCTAAEMLHECKRLEQAGITYTANFLNGVTDRSLSQQHARESARLFNQLAPKMVACTSFTPFAGTPLAEDVANGKITLVTEKERLEELKLFLTELNIPTKIFNTKTSAVDVRGTFPQDKTAILARIQDALDNTTEATLQAHRQSLRSL